MDTLLNWIVDFAMTTGVRLVGSVLIVVIGFMLVNKVIKFVRNSDKFKHIEKNAINFITSFIGFVLKAVIILTAANYLGVPMTNVVAIVGSCGLAVGLALQGSLSNFAGGIMLLIFKPFKNGDFINVNGLEGTVSDITILYTYLKTLDNKTVIIPNSTVSNASITNYSAEKLRRVDVSIAVSYKSDVEKVKSVLLDFAKDIPYVEKQPECAVVISSYGDSSISFTIRAWTPTEHYWDVAGAINYGLQKVLADNNIEIPYPQLDVHIEK